MFYTYNTRYRYGTVRYIRYSVPVHSLNCNIINYILKYIKAFVDYQSHLLLYRIYRYSTVVLVLKYIKVYINIIKKINTVCYNIPYNNIIV